MSSPITINYPAPSRAHDRSLSELSSSPSSPGLYVPIHKRSRLPGLDTASTDLHPASMRTSLSVGTPSSYASSRARSVSPAPSSVRSISPVPVPSTSLPIYTPADLLLLSDSPLSRLSSEARDVLRTIAPEVMQSRRQRKAHEWRARHPQGSLPLASSGTHRRTSSSVSSESEGERAMTWRV